MGQAVNWKLRQKVPTSNVVILKQSVGQGAKAVPLLFVNYRYEYQLPRKNIKSEKKNSSAFHIDYLLNKYIFFLKSFGIIGQE